MARSDAPHAAPAPALERIYPLIPNAEYEQLHAYVQAAEAVREAAMGVYFTMKHRADGYVIGHALAELGVALRASGMSEDPPYVRP